MSPQYRQLLLILYLYDCSHVLSAARALIELDDLQVNAVAARIELDLRIGAAFTRLQTLQLKHLSDSLAETLISYGMFLGRNLVHRSLLTFFRVLPISHVRFCCGPVFTCKELQAGALLGYQGDACQGQD